jgi:hypothetical protein
MIKGAWLRMGMLCLLIVLLAAMAVDVHPFPATCLCVLVVLHVVLFRLEQTP